LAETFILIYNAGLWENLSEPCQAFGKSLLQEMMDKGVKLKAPEPVGLSLSLSEYMQIVSNSLNLKGLNSDFWQYVVRIQYLMMSIEKDPLMARKLKEQSAIGGYIAEIFGE